MTTISHLFCSASGNVVSSTDFFYITALSKSVSQPELAHTALSVGLLTKLQDNQISLVGTRKTYSQIQELISFLVKSVIDPSIKQELQSLQNNPSLAIDYLFKASVSNKVVFVHKTKEYYLKFSVVGAEHALDFEIDASEQLSLYKLIKEFCLKITNQFQYAKKNEDLEIIIDYSIEEAVTMLLCELSSPLCVKEEYPWCHTSVISSIKQELQNYALTLEEDSEKIKVLPRKTVLSVMQKLYFVLKYASTLSIVAGALCPARVLIKSDAPAARPGRTFN